MAPVLGVEGRPTPNPGPARGADVLTQPGIPNEFALSTTCYGTRLRTIEDQAFATVAMGFRRLEIGISESPVTLNGFEQSRRETGIEVRAIVAGCLDPQTNQTTGPKLGSPDEDLRERALNCMRRHLRLAQKYECPVVIVRGCEFDDRGTRDDAERLRVRILRDEHEDGVHEAARELVTRVQKKGSKQVEHLCRSLHTLLAEFPGMRIAIEVGRSLMDLLTFESVGWVLDDLERQGLGYWHDTGRVHQLERLGFLPQGAWLDAYATRLMGVHLQDAAEGAAEMPPGSGEVDFRLVKSYLGSGTERVVEVHSRHGRAEILSSVQFLVDKGF